MSGYHAVPAGRRCRHTLSHTARTLRILLQHADADPRLQPWWTDVLLRAQAGPKQPGAAAAGGEASTEGVTAALRGLFQRGQSSQWGRARGSARPSRAGSTPAGSAVEPAAAAAAADATTCAHEAPAQQAMAADSSAGSPPASGSVTPQTGGASSAPSRPASASTAAHSKAPAEAAAATPAASAAALSSPGSPSAASQPAGAASKGRPRVPGGALQRLLADDAIVLQVLLCSRAGVLQRAGMCVHLFVAHWCWQHAPAPRHLGGNAPARCFMTAHMQPGVRAGMMQCAVQRVFHDSPYSAWRRSRHDAGRGAEGLV